MIHSSKFGKPVMKIKMNILAILLYLLIYYSDNSFAQKKEGVTIMLNDIKDDKYHFKHLIMDMLYNTLKPFKCVAIITDQENNGIFRTTLFAKLGAHITFFMIVVQDSEDLLSPYDYTQEILISAREDDCQTYLILLSNGIQMSRLLRFADRYRIVNTRANFIMLYDVRLFEKELHYLWGRLINVIFIREYQGVKTTAAGKTIIPWFELSTVPFPSPIRGVLVPRRVDIWRQNKFRNGIDLFRDKTSDLRNQTLKIVTFQHMPAASKIIMPTYKQVKTVYPIANGTHGYTGLEIEILSTVSKAMHFFPELYEPDNADTEYWGDKGSDGQYSGLFGEIIKSRADIALGDLYYTPDILDLMDLTTPYNTECLTFLTPEALTSNSWKALLLPFKPAFWIVLNIAIIFCAVSFHYLAKFQRNVSLANMALTPIEEVLRTPTPPPITRGLPYRRRKRELTPETPESEKEVLPIVEESVTTVPMMLHMENKDNNAKYAALMLLHEPSKPPEGTPEGLWVFLEFINSVLYTYSMLLLISLPKLPTGWSLRMLTGWYWVYCLLVATGYKASMTAILANPPQKVTIDTLEALVKSDLSCGSWSEINKEFFKTSLDPASQAIGAKFETVVDTDLYIDRVAHGTFAFYENRYFLKHASVKRQLKITAQLTNNSMGKLSTKRITEEVTKKTVHVMKDCIINMPISIGLQKNSPIKPRIDKFIRRVLEAGLITKWLDDVMAPVLNAEMFAEAESGLMTFNKFFGGVVALGIGYFISICALIGEMLYFHYVVKRHPDYNKYSKMIKKTTE